MAADGARGYLAPMASHPSIAGRLKPLSGLDAMFLYLETSRAPMHVGSLSIFDGGLGFDAFRSHLLSRLHLVPSFRQRLVNVPLGLDKPYWHDDPDFHIDRHLHHTALPRPGDWRQLRRLCSREFGRPLDRSRPLWEMVFVEGLDAVPQIPPGSVGLVTRIHHSAIDGISGADILGVLLDLLPEGRQMPAAPPYDPGPVPSRREMLGVGVRQLVRRPQILPRVLREAVRATRSARRSASAEGELAPTIPFSAPATPINAPLSADRLWNTALLSLDRVRNLKQIAGCTVNDVVLAICAGALRRWLLLHDALPSEPLVAMVPVSTRTAAEKNTMGNQVSAMFVQLATEVADPVERLNRIRSHTTSSKAWQGALDAKTLMRASELVPFGLATQASRLYARAELANLHRPAYNCVITNVPGPQVPLYVGGSRLLAQMGMAPILEGMGLILTVTTYAGVMSFSAFSSPAVMPDLDAFTRMIRESANELEAALLPRAQRIEAEGPGLAAMLSDLEARLARDPNGERLARGVYRFDLTGPEPQRWVFDLRASPDRPGEGTDEVDCTLRMEGRHFRAMAAGALDGTAAFMQGKLQVTGDVNAAIGFGGALARLATTGVGQA